MGLPWIQVASEVIDHGAADLALMLNWDEARAGWGMVKGFDWALKRADPKRPPSYSRVIRGPHAARLVARAFGWTGDADIFVSAAEHLPKPPLARLEDGSIDIHGLDRYDRAWKKNNPDLWKALQAEPGTEPRRDSDGVAPETGTKPAPNRAGTPPQDRDRDLKTFSARAEPVNANDTLRDAVEGVWERHRGVKPKGITDFDLREAFAKADSDPRELLRVLANALKSTYPKLARFSDLLKFWDDYAATKGPEPGPQKAKNPNARATQEDRVDANYAPPLTADGEIDLMGVGS